MEIWGQWVHGNSASEKFSLNYGGTPSLFQATASVPENIGEVTLLLLAADRAGNTGQHAITYRVAP